MSTDVTEAAISAVNAPPLDKRGYALDPAGKVAPMTPAAGPLARILSDKALTALIEGYQRDDEAAIAAQKQYRQWHWASILARYGMILLGILALAFTDTLEHLLGRSVKPWLGAAVVLQLALLLVALLIDFLMRSTQPLERWLRLRSYAEVKRLAFFDLIASQQEEVRDGEVKLEPLQLEFIVSYLLEPQLEYFTRRSKELGGKKELGTLSFLVLAGTILYTAVQLLLGLAVQLRLFEPPFQVDPAEAMGRGLIGAAFAVLLASTAMSQLDERNALRFRQTAANLRNLKDHYLVHARRGAARCDRATMLSFVRLVTEQVGFGAPDFLSLEHLNAISAETMPARPSPDPKEARDVMTNEEARGASTATQKPESKASPPA